MAVTKDQKSAILEGLVEKFGKSQSVVFADYRGLDVASVSDLRVRLREKDAEMKIAKKTLIRLAAKENNIEVDASEMEGPVAATFSYEDAMAGIKVLFNFSKENENLKLLGGVIDGKVVSAEVIQEYAKLPSRDELLAKLIGSMNAPVSGTVGIFSNIISGFVRVLDGIRENMPAEAAPVVEAAPAPEVKEEVASEESAAAEEKAEPALADEAA